MSRNLTDRLITPDLVPRMPPTGGGAAPGGYAPGEKVTELHLQNWVTRPGARPGVRQEGTNLVVTAGTTPTPLTNGSLEADTILLNVWSTAANSVFYGFSNLSLNAGAGNGIELQPGQPVVLSAENGRQPWELQRILEMLLAIQSLDKQFPPVLGQYRAPRVIIDTASVFLVAATPTPVSVMIFFAPPQQ